MMFIKKYKMNKFFFFREENGKNVPKMKDDFQENGQIEVMENWEKLRKRSWKVMEVQNSKEYEPC